MKRLSPIVKQHLIYHENQIREAVWQLHFSRCNNTIIHELLVDQGRARIDIALISPDLHGIELKSDGDTLDRLHKQMHLYSPSFEKMTLIVGYSHLYEAMEILPKWWGIIVVEKSISGLIYFDQVRDNKKNPQMCKRSLLALLNSQEVCGLISNLALPIRTSASFSQLITTVANELKTEQIIAHVKAALVGRTQPNHAFVTQ